MLKERLMDYLPDPNTIKGGLASIVDTIQQEAPLVVQEIINWNIAYHLLCQIGCIICFVTIFIFVQKKSWKWAIKYQDATTGFSYFIGIVFPLLLLIPCIIGFVMHFGWLKPMIAPRLFLLEYFGNLIK